MLAEMGRSLKRLMNSSIAAIWLAGLNLSVLSCFGLMLWLILGFCSIWNVIWAKKFRFIELPGARLPYFAFEKLHKGVCFGGNVVLVGPGNRSELMGGC